MWLAAYQHVLKTVELSRVHLFDIATQYRAIFTDEDPLVLANQDPNTNESAIYYSWIIQKVLSFKHRKRRLYIESCFFFNDR